MKKADNNFYELRELLKIKRLEQPPPGFFDELPNRIIARIIEDKAQAQTPWIVKLANIFPRPVYYPLAAILVIALCVAGLNLSLSTNTSHAGANADTEWLKMSLSQSTPTSIQPFADNASTESENVVTTSSTGSSLNPVMAEQPPDFLFKPETQQAQTVNYQFPTNMD
ncbi:MAG: hypothetical protein K9N48_04320 [Verrucomicrobia bacterium]|nr:hypothetical protein [Verrucomicrobiota bacterium]MCF7709026.1 hypothetical protein [Verrucomicrobiota bacterium]